MKAKKLCIILSILIVIILITTSTACNLFRKSQEETAIESTEEDEGKETIEEEQVEEEAEEIEDKTPSEEEEESTEKIEDTETSQETLEQKEAPTINLQIYEGPIYSPTNNICYYRIEAIVTGSPEPTMEFSKDDSLGAWGTNKCQINIQSPSEIYRLTATATNSEGTATASIDLSWGCEEAAEEEEEEMTGGRGGDGDDIIDITLPAIATEIFIIPITFYYDFTSNAPSAQWRSYCWHYNPPPMGFIVDFGDTYTRYGAAFYGDNITLEDGNTYPRVLKTYPYKYNQGFICGIYEDITVPENATFTTRVGFEEGHSTSGVFFQIFFAEDDVLNDYCSWCWIASTYKEYDGSLRQLTYDISSIGGRTGNFIFLVKWGTGREDRFGVWVYPLIITIP